MEKIFKRLYDLYFDEDYFDIRILNDDRYNEVVHKITQIKDDIVYLDDKTKIKKNIEELSALYMSLSDIYRYHDFSQGMFIGIMIGINSVQNTDICLNNKFITLFNQLMEE